MDVVGLCSRGRYLDSVSGRHCHVSPCMLLNNSLSQSKLSGRLQRDCRSKNQKCCLSNINRYESRGPGRVLEFRVEFMKKDEVNSGVNDRTGTHKGVVFDI